MWRWVTSMYFFKYEMIKMILMLILFLFVFPCLQEQDIFHGS